MTWYSWKRAVQVSMRSCGSVQSSAIRVQQLQSSWSCRVEAVGVVNERAVVQRASRSFAGHPIAIILFQYCTLQPFKLSCTIQMLLRSFFELVDVCVRLSCVYRMRVAH